MNGHRFPQIVLLAWTLSLAGAGPVPAGVRQLRVKVLSVRAHDAAAFTQGFLLDETKPGEVRLFESTGLYGQSTLREVDLQSGKVLRSVALPATHFGEGLALAGDRLIQLTWRERVAHVYDRDTFEKVEQLSYAGEGWGLCDDGERLIMSDGSSRLFFRSAETFELLGHVDVTLEGRPRDLLNELEFANGHVYANVWFEDFIVKIEPSTGEVVAVIDASGLLSASEEERANVLNGIAYREESRTFFLTGKLWPRVYEVTFEEPAVERNLLRGDCNGDGRVAGEVTDAVSLLGYNFLGAPRPPCLAACDADGDGLVAGRVTDAVYLLAYSFLGGPAPVPPFPDCGRGDLPGDGFLGCGESPATCR